MGTYILSLLFVLLRCPAENSGCQDSHSNCPTLVANGGDCSSSTLGATCKLSCNNCHIADCGDYHASCASWAASGECTANPGYMLVSCQISCRECSPETTTIPVTIQQQMTSSPTTMTSFATTTPPRTTTTPPRTTTIPPTTAPTTTTTTETTTLSSPATITAANTTPSPVATTTTTTKSTTAANATYKQPNCVCTCVKNPLFTFDTTDTDTLEMQVRSAMETIKAELKVNTTSLSSSIRTRICASDDRQSSATIGVVGAVLLGVVFGTLVLTDAVNFIAYIVSRRT